MTPKGGEESVPRSSRALAWDGARRAPPFPSFLSPRPRVMIALSTAQKGRRMKGIAILAAVAAVLTLGGCNRTAATANSSNATVNMATANSSTATGGNMAAAQTADAGKLNSGGGAVPASSSGTMRLDRTFIMGRWTDDGDCSKAVEFTQDGRFINADQSNGLWNLDGDRLTMTGNGTMHLRISPIDQNTITVIHDDGSLGRSTRC
jgi:hypothetical protein